MKIMTLVVGLLISTICFGQIKNDDDYESINKALLAYYESFYDGNVPSFSKYISKNINKYGYWKDKDGKFEGEKLTYEDMIKYVKRIDSEGNDMDTSIKEIQIFDILKNTASAKLKFWWGYDYILLAKEDDQWKIRMVLWEGPLE